MLVLEEFALTHLDQTGQAEVDAARLLLDLHVADGDVWHDGQHQGLERLVEAVREALGPGHLNTGPRRHVTTDCFMWH